MQITRQADYALRTIIYLSRLGEDEKASTSNIAEKQHIPSSFLAKIISQLSVAGIIHTSRGAHGGVSLAKSPDKISVLDVIEAIDGPVMLNECTHNPGICIFTKDCPMHVMWCDTRKELVNKLETITFEQFSSSKYAVL
ncbi:MAG TPA: Rrf2 family transcriptional regulator [Anaerolineaceae bacterium]|jgi:Rrf2 family protein|nr:Rrf2 family transcriptional regulator [Anaerolineaceae bacterium]